MNNKQATIAGILACGYEEEPGRSRKYRCFNKPAPEGVPTRTLLVGKSGALRVIPESCSAISESLSKTDSKVHKAYQYVGRMADRIDWLPAPKCREIVAQFVRGEISA